MIQLPPSILEDLKLVSQVSKELGMKFYVVGGLPRDIISGKGVDDNTDLDITEENGNAFDLAFFVASKFKLPEPTVYENSGTAMVKMPNGRIVEFHNAYHNVTHIIDQLYKIKIEPTSINKDVYSRDFTINTLLYDIESNNILDITKFGVSDIKNKILRTPIDPMKSLGIDPKRVLRGIRFKIEMGLKPTEEYIEAEKYFIPTLANFMIIHPNSQMLIDTVKKAFEANKEQAYNEFTRLGLMQYVPRVDEGMDDMARQQIFGDPNKINTFAANFNDSRQNLIDLEEEESGDVNDFLGDRKPSLYETQSYNLSGPDIQLWIYNGSTIDSKRIKDYEDGFFDPTHNDLWEGIDVENFWRGRFDPKTKKVYIEIPSSFGRPAKNKISSEIINSLKRKFGSDINIVCPSCNTYAKAENWYKAANFLEPMEPTGPSEIPQYKMDIKNDAFIHFTTKGNAEKIIKDGFINPNNGTAFAVSSIYGTWMPEVQYSPQAMTSKKLKDEDMVAIYFLTEDKPTFFDPIDDYKEKPSYGFSEEVGWGKPIKLEAAEIISVDKAREILLSTPEKLQHKENFQPYGKGWKNPEDIDMNDLIDMGDSGLVNYAKNYLTLNKEAQATPSAVTINPGASPSEKGMIQHLLDSREKHRAYLRRRRTEHKKDTINKKKIFDALDDGHLETLTRQPDKRQEKVKNIFNNLGNSNELV